MTISAIFHAINLAIIRNILLGERTMTIDACASTRVPYLLHSIQGAPLRGMTVIISDYNISKLYTLWVYSV